MLKIWCLLLIVHAYMHANSLIEQLQQVGCVELCNDSHGSQSYDNLYQSFDQLIDFFQRNPKWAQKLYCAKERFIRSSDQALYGTDFCGWYDDSLVSGRHQISFYYSIHFHTFLSVQYPEIIKQPEIQNFLQQCFDIQKPCHDFFKAITMQLGIESIFSSTSFQVPILFKVVKYFQNYNVTKPHYDGTAFSLLLDSTHDESLFISGYKPILTEQDFFSVHKNVASNRYQSSMLLIPGTLLTEFCIYPTPHLVMHSGQIRYATIAFAMRPNFIAPKIEFALLPNFKSCNVA